MSALRLAIVPSDRGLGDGVGAVDLVLQSAAQGQGVRRRPFQVEAGGLEAVVDPVGLGADLGQGQAIGVGQVGRAEVNQRPPAVAEVVGETLDVVPVQLDGGLQGLLKSDRL